MAVKKTARQKAKERDRARGDDLKNFWTGHRRRMTFSDDEWRATVLRGRGTTSLDVSDLIETVDWSDSGPILTGTVSLRHPLGGRLDISEGHQVRLEHRRVGTGRWREIWTMRLGATEGEGVNIAPKDHSYSFNMADQLAQQAKTKVDFNIKKTKAHPKGERVDLALRRFCRQEHIPYRRFPRMRHYITKQSFHQKTVVDILQALIRTENTNSKREYILRWRTARVEVIRKKRSEFMYEFADTIMDATLNQARRAGFATIIKVTATAEKGKGKDAKNVTKHKKKNIKVTVTRDSLQQRYGQITKTLSVKANSAAEARKKGLDELAKITKPKDTVSFSHSGVASLRRWDAVHIEFDEPVGYSEIAYVSQVMHHLSSSDYTMDVEVQFTDPFVKKKKKKKDKKKKDAASKRGRNQSDTSKKDYPKPVTAGQRTDDKKSTTPTAPRHPTAGEQLSAKGLQ